MSGVNLTYTPEISQMKKIYYFNPNLQVVVNRTEWIFGVGKCTEVFFQIWEGLVIATGQT